MIMPTLVRFLLLLLVLVSFDLLLPEHVMVEARKLNSNSLSFVVDLIRRDTPISPYYKSSMTSETNHKRKYLGAVSFGHHFRLSSTHYAESDNMDMDVTPNGGGYVMRFGIGTPPVEFTAIADTGSDLIWVQCSPCQHCIPQEVPLFNPTKSSTYQTPQCDSEHNNNEGPCEYFVSYGDGTNSTGVLSTDVITLTSTPTTSSYIFGCGYDQYGHLGLNADGIVGLGTGSSSLVSQLGPDINYKFSYCLTPISSGVNGKLIFGPVAAAPGAITTPFSIQLPHTFYYLSLDDISIGNTSVPVGRQDVILDSGTTLTYLELSVYNGVRNAVMGSIGLTVRSVGLYDLCYDSQQSGGGFNPPDVVFHFKGADVVLKAVNTFREVEGLLCLAMMPTHDRFIFGNIAQVNFEVGYDLQAKQVSFAPTDCSNYQ